MAAVFKVFIARSSTEASRVVLLDAFVDGVPCRGNVRDAIPGWCTLIVSFAWTSILYPGGKNVLKPTIRSGWPLKRFDTLFITPGVSMLKKRKRKISYWSISSGRKNDMCATVMEELDQTFPRLTFVTWILSLCPRNHCTLEADSRTAA